MEGKDGFEELVKERQAARKLARRQAMRGDPVCGGMFALESFAQDAGLGYISGTVQEWGDEEEGEW